MIAALVLALAAASASAEDRTRVDLALGGSLPFNFEEAPDAAVSGALVRASALGRHGDWLASVEGYALFLNRGRAWMGHASVGHALPACPAWLVASWLSVSSLPYPGLPSNAGRQAPGLGAVFLMELEGLADGEARFAMSWFPTESTIYQSMYVGWSFGPVGLRVGGFGLRVPGGRQLTGFTLDLVHHFR